MDHSMDDLITFVSCLKKRDAGDVLHRGACGRRFEFTVSWPMNFPGPDEVWLRIVCKRTLLPELQMPMDGDAYYELGQKELNDALEIRPFRTAELVECAINRLDLPKPVEDFPFGWKDGTMTWREAILAGEENNPIWLEALRCTHNPMHSNEHE